MISHMTDQIITTKTTTVIAAGAVGLPWWMPWLEEGSRVAALVVPILGALWLMLQIAFFLWSRLGPKADVAKLTKRR